MGEFLNQVRRGQIRRPTQIGFTLEAWRQGYENITQGDAADLDLFNAGKVFDGIFAGLRNKLSRGQFQHYRRSDRLLAIGAFINHEVAALGRKGPQQPRQAENLAPFLITDLINHTVTLRSGIRITPDEVLGTVIDAAVSPLDEALQASDEGVPLTVDASNDIGLALIVANLYCVAVDLWLSCLWTENLIEQVQPGLIVIKVRDADAARHAAVSEHRYQNYLWQSVQNSCRIWRDQLSIIGKKGLTVKRGVTNFDPRSRGNPFAVGNLYLHRKRNIPLDIAHWIVANEDYLQPFTRLPLPMTKGLTIEILHKIWQVLASLVRATLRRVPGEPGNLNWFLAHAVRVTRAQIVSVIARSLELDGIVIDAALQFLTY